MDKRRKKIDPEKERALRDNFDRDIAENRLSLGEAVKTMRRISKLTQAEFAAHRGVDLTTLKTIESGTANPRVSTLNKIADVFGLEVRFVRRTRSHDA
ncbi:MAG: hypothetical protein RIR18_746 [Pseudomonadota bacterium]|jgi:DNA-binding XRE family transcriptional regulator